ncbi:MAG: HEAT repeat domain-containing protein, partial [Planctomycetaceae bacterium]|nr:HEAT repeat domain-containing protein [Planctomycetaceae bacterium]
MWFCLAFVALATAGARETTTWIEQLLLWERVSGEPQDATYQAFKTAQAYVYDERWNDAITNLQSFITKYAQSKYVDDAQFWMCYSREKRGDDAETVFTAYKDFIAKYPRSEYVDDAKANMIKLATTLAGAGKTKYRAEVAAMQSSDDEELRLQALYALSQHDDPATVQTLTSLLESETNAKIRQKIVHVFGNLSDASAGETLSRLATSDPDAGVRKSAVYAIGNRSSSG